MFSLNCSLPEASHFTSYGENSDYPQGTIFTDDSQFIEVMFIVATLTNEQEKLYWTTGASKILTCNNAISLQRALEALIDQSSENEYISVALIKSYGEELLECAALTRTHASPRSNYYAYLFHDCLNSYMSGSICSSIIDLTAKAKYQYEIDNEVANTTKEYAQPFLIE